MLLEAKSRGSTPKVLLKTLTIAAAVMLTSMFSVNSNAQGLPCYPEMCGAFYSTPAYNYTPVLYSYMPCDVLVGYIVMDSIIAHIRELYPYYSSQAELINGLTATGDTLNYALKYLYRLQDYNPILYYTFLNTPQTTKRQPMTLLGDLTKHIRKVKGLKYEEVIKADYILQVHINSTQTITDYGTAPDYDNSYTIVVHTSVTDTIKGQILPAFTNGIIVIKEADSEGEIVCQNSNFPATTDFLFSFTRGWARIPAVEKDYIVFARLIGWCSTGGTQYYEIRPTMLNGDNSDGIFPIENGYVTDYSNVFGLGKQVPLQQFKDAVNAFVNSVKNYGE
ncbi:MAG: hypothetical protein LBO69_03440 [Ignavibacteria bacterium]|jgi:hypothetical protein|nr:hypothetical protein [Ignavibacteria bacterium]